MDALRDAFDRWYWDNRLALDGYTNQGRCLQAFQAGYAEAAAGPLVAAGEIVRIIPKRGPERLMRVAHVEHHVITLSDLDGKEG